MREINQQVIDLIHDAHPNLDRVKLGSILKATQQAITALEAGGGVGSEGPTGTVDSVPVPGREFNVLRLTDTVTIQGFAAPAITDRPVFLTVISNNETTFKHMNSATGADNIFMPQLADLTVHPGSVTQFVYSGGVWNHAGGAQAAEPA